MYVIYIQDHKALRGTAREELKGNKQSEVQCYQCEGVCTILWKPILFNSGDLCLFRGAEVYVEMKHVDLASKKCLQERLHKQK